jgi:hypothetical protein
MQEVYTSTITTDIALERNLFAPAFGDSVADAAAQKNRSRSTFSSDCLKG